MLIIVSLARLLWLNFYIRYSVAFEACLSVIGFWHVWASCAFYTCLSVMGCLHLLRDGLFLNMWKRHVLLSSFGVTVSFLHVWASWAFASFSVTWGFGWPPTRRRRVSLPVFYWTAWFFRSELCLSPVIIRTRVVVWCSPAIRRIMNCRWSSDHAAVLLIRARKLGWRFRASVHHTYMTIMEGNNHNAALPRFPPSLSVFVWYVVMTILWHFTPPTILLI